MSEKKEANEPQSIPTISEESTSLGDIKINHSVIASIVRIAAMEIDGVIAVGGESFVDGIREIFRGRDSDHGILVSEDEGGQYVIEVRVVMRFGVELAKVAMQVQENVSEQIKCMTMKEVAKVDVVIEVVRNEEDKDVDIEDWTDATR